MNDTPQPALNITVLAGLISAVALLAIARLNRAIPLFDMGELDQAKALIALAAPVVAGVLIRRRVVPTAKVQEHVDVGVAMGYAQALEDNPRPVRPLRAR